MKNKLIDILKKADTAPYRSIPFWSWNDKLEKQELVEQINWMKKHGMGGYFMHARGGLLTEYLGEEWFDCIKACLDEGERLGMDSWAYDEFGWPSGFVGGKLLDEISNRDKYLTYSMGEYAPEAMVSYLIDGDSLVRTCEGGRGEYLNVFEHISASTADILNPEVVDKFIAETHELYKRKLGEGFGTLKGFFTDEPQYYRRNQPYTDTVKKYFTEHYGEDILDGIGLLFVEKKGYRGFRYRYWRAMQELMLHSFAKKVYDWCDANGLMLTGHYIEETSLEGQMTCCAGIMPYYEYEHIPGIDKLDRKIENPIASKQVSSVARQLGKKRVLTEIYAMCGWDVTPDELRVIAESQYVNGVNLMCQHLLPYSEHGQRKRDYPAHYSWANPWVRRDFKGFNDYFTRLGYLLGESEERVNVAIFAPVRSAYFEYKRDKRKGIYEDIDKPYLDLMKHYSAMNVPYHVIDETILGKHGSVEGGRLKVGQCTYDYVVFPNVWTMDESSHSLLAEFYKNGGRLLFTGCKPTYLGGEEFEYAFDTNVTEEEILAAQPYRVDKLDTGVQSTYRTIDGIDYIYAVNTDTEKGAQITFSGCFAGFEAVDLQTMTTRRVGRTVSFGPGQSYILTCTDTSAEEEGEVRSITLEPPFEIVECSDNYLTLDKVKFSLDGVSYSQKLSGFGVFNELLKMRYSGPVYLKYEFEVEDVPERIRFLTEDMRRIECKINGKPVVFDGVSDFEKKIYSADVAFAVKRGINEIIQKIDFYESEQVYYVLFDKNVTESLKNCLSYDVTIEACYLQGDFAVYSRGGFTPGTTPNVYLAEDDFYLGKRKTVITNMVTEGYPFFAGDVCLKKTLEFRGERTLLDLKGRMHLTEIFVNGRRVEKSYFKNTADITHYLTVGENEILVHIYSGNRNLLGPHHLKDQEEPIRVSPASFELIGTWENGKSVKERDSYSFVGFGIFEE